MRARRSRREGQGGAGVRAFARKWSTYLSVYYANMLEFRAELFLWMIATILPLIMMGPWMEAGASGRFGLDEVAFARYFLAAFVVRQFSLAWIIYEFEFMVSSGRLSPLLLHPIDPFWRFVSTHLSEHVARLPFVVGLVAVALSVFPQAVVEPGGGLWHPSPGRLALAVCATYAAFTLRFLLQYTLALLAFWFERVSAFDRIVFLPYLFLSGLIAPLEVFPEAVREATLVTPFPYLVWFPARVLCGHGTPAEIGRGFAIVGAWILVIVVVNRFAWRRGLTHYSAMGA